MEAAPRLLVVEDCDTQRRLLVRLFERAVPGRVVQGVATAEEALDQISAFEPHAVLCDTELPGAGGLELVRRLRERDRKGLLVLMSATACADSARAAAEAGADAFLAKERVVEDFERLFAARAGRP